MRTTLHSNKLLILSRSAPPLISGSSTVIENIIKGFPSEDVLVLSERFLNIKNVTADKYGKRIKHITLAPKVNWFGSGLFRKIQIPTSLVLTIFHFIRFKPRKILIVYPSAEYLLLGFLLSRIFRADFYSYFHNTYYENMSGYERKISQKLQNKIFSISKIIFLISDGMLQFYNARYPQIKKFETLPHSFNEEVPNYINVDIHGKAKLTIIGNINESCRDSAERMLRTLSVIDDVTFRIFSNIPEEYFVQLGINKDSLDRIPSLDRSSFIDRIRDGDVMLFPHGFDGRLAQIEYDTIFPTKTIEYLISGKPILYHGPNNAYITSFLREHDCALVVDNKDEKAIESGLMSLLRNKALRERLVRNACVAAERYSVDNVIKKFKCQIEI